MKIVALSDIIINEPFASSKPRDGKMNNARNYYAEHGCVDGSIVVNHNNILLDGYIKYLVLKENNVSYVNVNVIKWIPKKKKSN
jgi:hypothetical protein